MLSSGDFDNFVNIIIITLRHVINAADQRSSRLVAILPGSGPKNNRF
jgi:hypothetical protein